MVEEGLGEEGLGTEAGTVVLGLAFGERTGLVALSGFLLGWVTTVGLLVSGPEPYRATRWAWFWLSAPPLGLLAFVVLSGPTPGLGIRRAGGRRLSGGWAFLVMLLLTGVVQPPWWW